MWLYLVLGVCAATCLNGGLVLVGLARFLPSLLNLLRYLTRLSLVCSFRLYRLILAALNPYAQRYCKLDLLAGRVRLVASIILSLVVALTVLLVLQISLNAWTVTPAVIHGLLVGLLWDDLSQPGQLQMGIKLS